MPAQQAMTNPPDPASTERSEGRGFKIEISPRTLLYIVLTCLGVWMIWQLWTVVVVVVVALVLVGTLDPMVAWLERHKLRRGYALALVFIAMTAAFIGVLVLSVPPLLGEIQKIVEGLPATRDRLVTELQHHAWAAPFAKQVKEVPLNDVMLRVASYSVDLLGIVGYGVTTLFLAIYLLADPRHAKGLLYAVIPRNHHVKLARILMELTVIVGGYMRGQLITSVAIAIFMFILMTALGVDNALSIAIFAGMTDIIPFVGGYVATAPSVAAVASRGPAWMIGVFLVGMLYQEFESRILIPRVYGRVLRLSPALVLLALLIGGTLLGVLGALLALPVAAGVQMLVRQLHLDLPGQPEHDQERERDVRAEDLYEKLTEGTPAAEAQIIAGELAQKLKETEAQGGSVTAELPAIEEQLADDARLVAQQAALAEAERNEEEADAAITASAGPNEPQIKAPVVRP